MVINKYSIVEVSCLSSMLIDNCLGFCIIAISDECQIIVNFELIRESNKIASSFIPKTIINRNTSLSVIEEIKASVDDDQIQFLLIGFILLFLVCIVITQISCFCCNRLKLSQVTYGQVEQLNDQETVRQEEKLSFISKM